MKGGRRTIGFAAALLGAALSPPSAFAHTLEEFQELCRTEAGLKLHQTVENVEGVLVPLNLWGPGPYAWGLVKGGYRFIEVLLGSAGPTYERYYTAGKGYYRHTLEGLGHPDCRPFEETLGPLARQAKLDLHALYGGRCLATRKIEAPTAAYRVDYQGSKWRPSPEDEADREARRWRQRPGDIIQRRTVYKDAAGGKIYAEFNLFEFVTKTVGALATTTVCPVMDEKKWNRPPVPETVLRPPPYTPPPPLELAAFDRETPWAATMLLPPPAADQVFELVKLKQPAPEAEAARRTAEAEFDELCRAKAGTRIYQTVENVRGFLDATSETSCKYCEWGITSQGFDFVEFKVSETFTPEQLQGYYVDRPGLYRYALENPDHPKCGPFFKKFEVRINRGIALDSKYNGKCVVAWPADNISAKYKVTYKDEKITRRGGEIWEYYSGYSDLAGKTILAEHRRFAFVPFADPGDPKSKTRSGFRSCPEKGPDYAPTLPNRVFIPPHTTVGR